MKLYELKQKQTVTMALTGTSGTANIKVNGTNYLATFTSTLTTSAANFVTSHSATILAAAGVVVTANTGTLTFKANLFGHPFTVEKAVMATGDLSSAAPVLTKTGLHMEIACDQLVSGGLFNILEIRDLKDNPSTTRDPLIYDVAEKGANGKLPILQRGTVSSQSALVAYATTNDMTLIQKNEDGTSPSTLVNQA